MTRRPMLALYALAVVLLAGLFAWDVLRRATSSAHDGALSLGPAGQSRPIDEEELRRRIHRGILSDREARYAHPPESGPADR